MTKTIQDIFEEVKTDLACGGYTIVEEELSKPWGGYYRLANTDAESFIKQHFPDITAKEARLGRDDVELSPKILMVSPKQRLSWQYHNRRAERWLFLTDGSYIRSSTDIQPEAEAAKAGVVVQFDRSERHRLIGGEDFTLVAEIWQHTDPDNPSSEEDIIRVEDDYRR